MKLRASYGTLGNQDFSDYQYSPAVVSGGFGLGGTNYPFGVSQTIQTGATQRTLANPDIRWQENTEANFGVDVNLLDSRLATAGAEVGEDGGAASRELVFDLVVGRDGI